MANNSLDDLPVHLYEQVEKAILKFRRTSKNRAAQQMLYDAITNAGLSGEYADEFINLEMAE